MLFTKINNNCESKFRCLTLVLPRGFFQRFEPRGGVILTLKVLILLNHYTKRYNSKNGFKVFPYHLYTSCKIFATIIFNIFHTTANCVTVGINSNSAGAQNSCENLKKSEKHKNRHKILKNFHKQLKILQWVYFNACELLLRYE